MPTYFGPIAPYCPISRDSPLGPESPWAPSIRTTIPRAHDLASAIAAVNIARTIITQLVFDKVINNIHTPPDGRSAGLQKPKTIDKRRHSRWKQGKKVKRKYRYYMKNPDGTDDKDNWVMTERIEAMSWSDKGWKTAMNWEYGDKGDGVPPYQGGGGAGGGDSGEGGGAPGMDAEPD